MEISPILESDINAAENGEMTEAEKARADHENDMRRQFVEAAHNWVGCLRYAGKRGALKPEDAERYDKMLWKYQKEYEEAGIELIKLEIEPRDWKELWGLAWPEMAGQEFDGKAFFEKRATEKMPF